MFVMLKYNSWQLVAKFSPEFCRKKVALFRSPLEIGGHYITSPNNGKCRAHSTLPQICIKFDTPNMDHLVHGNFLTISFATWSCCSVHPSVGTSELHSLSVYLSLGLPHYLGYITPSTIIYLLYSWIKNFWDSQVRLGNVVSKFGESLVDLTIDPAF